MEDKEKKVLLYLADKVLSGRDLITYKARLRGKTQEQIGRIIERSTESVRLITNSCVDQLDEYIQALKRFEKLTAETEALETKAAVLKLSLKDYDISPKAVLNEPLSEFRFSVRCTNVLNRMFPKGKVLDLVKAIKSKGDEHFLEQKHCGVGTLDEIKKFLIKNEVWYQMWE